MKKLYRIRMSRNEWFIRYYENNVEVRTEGPFKELSKARKVADASGYIDWDKGYV